MELVILGLKRKSDSKLYVFDVVQGKRNIPIKIGETKVIDVLSPFPFSNFSSLDGEKIDFKKFDKCYLKVNGELKDSEYHSMKSGGITYYRFNNREVTLIEEFHDIFQYSLQMLNSFGSQLGTYDLTTWVMHNETKNEAEYNAMKKIILKSVQSKNNKKYGLDISVDKYTVRYIGYFRELAEKGYNITFGRYGSSDRNATTYIKADVSDEDLLFMLKGNGYVSTMFIQHPKFTVEFYNKYIANTDFEIELFDYAYSDKLTKLLSKGLDADEIYARVFQHRLNTINSGWWSDYDSLEHLLNDKNFEIRIEHRSPFDHYCCEDCDGYDIYEHYTEEELEGYDVEIDERVDYINKLINGWDNYLSKDSHSLFEFVPTRILEKVENSSFIIGILESRKSL